MTNTNKPGRAVALAGGLPAIVEIAHNAVIRPMQAPPAPTPVGPDQNFGFRRSVVRLVVSGLGVDPAMQDKIRTGIYADFYGLNLKFKGFSWSEDFLHGDTGWSGVARAIINALDGASDASKPPADRVKDLRKAIAATEAFVQFQDAVPAAAQALSQALTPADMQFVRDEVGAFFSGRRDKRCASGDGFMVDVLAAVLDIGVSCGAVALSFQSLRNIPSKYNLDPESGNVTPYLKHWDNALRYLAKIIGRLASLPPAAELRGTIEAEIVAIIAAEEERQRKEAEERDARALEQMRRAAEEGERREKARKEFEAQWEAELRARQEADRQESERRKEICRRDAEEELRRQGLHDLADRFKSGPHPEPRAETKTPNKAAKVGSRRQAREGGRAAD
jgi:hypothetical protein